MKEKYEKEIKRQKTQRVSNSTFLTPASALYLNEAIRNNVSKVDEEILRAGLHD
jgi:hypothetical protein